MAVGRATIPRVLDRKVPAAEVAAVHADAPSPAQVRARVELNELIDDEDFRGRMRLEPVRERITAAKEAGIDPLGPDAVPTVRTVVQLFTQACPHIPDAKVTTRMIQQLAVTDAPRMERYRRLVWAVNGWQVLPGLLPDLSCARQRRQLDSVKR